MNECKPITTILVTNEIFKKEDGFEKADVSHNKSLIGCILYITATRLVIIYVTRLLLKFMQNPTQTHYTAEKKKSKILSGYKRL